MQNTDEIMYISNIQLKPNKAPLINPLLLILLVVKNEEIKILSVDIKIIAGNIISEDILVTDKNNDNKNINIKDKVKQTNNPLFTAMDRTAHRTPCKTELKHNPMLGIYKNGINPNKMQIKFTMLL